MTEETTAIEKTNGPKTFADLLLAAKESIESVMPRHLSAERLMKIARVAWSRSPKLRECNAMTLVQCVMEAAELGLDVSGTLGTAYLVPFKNGHTGQMEATLIIGYRGMIELARRSGMIQSVEARAVFQGEEFRLEQGLNPVLHHKPDLDAVPDKKDFRGCYMVARLKDGGTHVEWMNKGEIDAIRARSKAGKFGPWVTDYVEMAKKTVLRRGFKMLPMSPEMVQGFTQSDVMEFGDDVLDNQPIQLPDGMDAGEGKVSALKNALSEGDKPRVRVADPSDPVATEKVTDRIAELQQQAKEKQDAEVEAHTNDPPAQPDPVDPTGSPTGTEGQPKVSGDASAEPPEDYVAGRIGDGTLAKDAHPAISAAEPSAMDVDNVEVVPDEEETILDKRYESLMEMIGQRAGYDKDTPAQIIEATTEKWLASKKWTKTALGDTALWKIVWNSATKARFRKPTVTA